MTLDTIVYGPIWTGDANNTRVEAAGIKDGKFVALGTKEELTKLKGATTKELKFDTPILPAFQDAHTHLIEGSLFDIRCNLHDMSIAEIFETIRNYEVTLKKEEWLLGGGWSMDDFQRENITKDDLDKIVGDRLVYLTARDGHSAWVSSATLKEFGIDKNMPDPEGGKIERDSDGDPTGILHETAIKIINQKLPIIAEKEWLAAFEIGQKLMHSLGITSWQDARIEETLLDAYLLAEAKGLVKSRIALALAWDRNRGLEQVEDLIRLRQKLKDSKITAPTVKLFLDGVMENHTASMIAEYNNAATHGEPLYTAEQVYEMVALLNHNGFGVHFHAVGDGATRLALEACEKSANASQVRNQISHLQIIDKVDIPRFKKAHVIANIQPYWACNDSQMLELCLPALGTNRYEQQYPFKSLQEAGAVLAAGSDWRVSTPNPIRQIQVAVTRLQENGEGDPHNKSEAIDIETGLKSFTAGAAYASEFENISGKIAPGMSADLIVLDGNIWEQDPQHLYRIKVSKTMYLGEWVFEKDQVNAQENQ